MLVTATQIHDGKKWLPQGTVIKLTDDGTIEAILDSSHKEIAKHYEGIVCPGFVNAHCHLELSHMKGKVPEHTGLITFLKQVATTRNNYTEEDKITARHHAFHDMIQNGIVAVGDISNTTDTLDLRVQDKIHFHSFVEALGFSEQPQKHFDYAMAVMHGFNGQATESKTLRQSIVPHAPYSVTEQLFSLIDKFDEQALLTIHNQETAAEDEYYKTKKGGVLDLFQSIGIDDSFFQPSDKSSLQTYIPWLSQTHPVIFVHNTFTTPEDITFAQTHLQNTYWCLCPNANMYIENRLPDISMLMQHCNNICIGTDSLSSNNQLSVLAELHTIQQHYPNIQWEQLLQWATYNGALALQMDDVVGSIESGKKPGLVLLDNNYNLSSIIA